MTQNPSSFYSKIPTFTWHLFEQAGVYFVIQIIREKKIMRNEFTYNKFQQKFKIFFFFKSFVQNGKASDADDVFEFEQLKFYIQKGTLLLNIKNHKIHVFRSWLNPNTSV
jgi:hypothetical protein